MKSMFEMIREFPSQLEQAIQIGASVSINSHSKKIQRIYVSGMGGSGIGADFVSSFIKPYATLPYIVGKSYEVPAFVNDETLVIISSYSGNTEETIECFKKIITKGSKIICIASGGEVMRMAEHYHLDRIQLPQGWSSPRACLGFSIVAQLFAIYKLGIIPDQFINELKGTINKLKIESNSILEKAKHLASYLEGKIPVIYCADSIEPVAVRFRQQLNENSKILCWHHVIPEMNHNELVGWRWTQNALAAVFIRNTNDHPRIQARIELTKEIVSHYTQNLIEIYSSGDSFIERSIYLVHLLDYVSVFLADYNKIDAVEVRVIDFLKSELAKL
ncbi:MAG: bifunctional phosphoglucose/phosphomannose isomerase [Saprospiraceae bacterium]|nr:bifunctional phosphoglucose/phosphomannose isomerase [Saprospiraceae bacterium]HRG67884.1 bifunctional phosphoglucose/phosphomannose isomerase [Saprospiraceae bacterium]